MQVQILVGEHVDEGRQILRLGCGRAGGQQRLARLEHRQRPQPGPDAARRALVQPDRAVFLPLRQQHPQRLRRAAQLAAAHRVALHVAAGAGTAQCLHRAQQAVRPARQADGGAEVHQALGVGGDVVRPVRGRQQHIGGGPQGALVRRHGQVAAIGQQPRQHAPHVAVQDGDPLAEAEGSDGGGSGAADAGQRRQLSRRVRKAAAEARHHLLRAAVQVARPAVVAQPAPQAEHLVLRRRGQRGDVREAGQEALVVAQHGRHLRLLQHDLRQPDAVRIAGALPGQVVAPVAALPGDQLAMELG